MIVDTAQLAALQRKGGDKFCWIAWQDVSSVFVTRRSLKSMTMNNSACKRR